MEQTAAKRIIVTGGAGFLGSHLCEALHTQGHYVICVDNFYTGSRENLSQLSGSERFEIVEHDIVQPLKADADAIYNLACAASPVDYQKQPVQTVRTCVEGVLHMLGIAHRLDIPILQASTSEVYGNPKEHPQTESYCGDVDPISIRACYDEGKRCAETLCFDYHRQYGTQIKVARIFNTYGPRMRSRDGRVVPNFIMQALKNEPITIYGDGNQTRSFCFYRDMIDAFIRCMESPAEFTGPVNLGNPDEYTMLELAEIVREMTHSKSELVFKPLPEGDPVRRRPDITRAKQHLDWQPTTPLRDGLKETIEWFERQLGK